MKTTRCTGLLACSLLFACTASRGNLSDPPVVPSWATASPSDVGLDGARLEKATEDISNGRWGNLHALVVVRNGKLVHEAYFAGRDEIWFDGYQHVQYGPTVKHGLRSVSKSFTSTLVGIAIDRGFIDSPDVHLSELLPDHAGLLEEEKSALTLRHVLTMSAGLRWAEGGQATEETDDQYDLQEAADPVELVLSREVEAEPGTEFNYSGGLTQVLVAVVEHATQRPFLDFAESELFDPLGIEQWEWFSLGNARPAGWTGLRLTARDMAKLGQVYLDGGHWKGRRVVSTEWVEAAFEAAIEEPSPGAPSHVSYSAYGFHWWYDVHDWEGGSLVFHSAMGNGGQRIVVVPDLDLVVVFFAGFYEDPSNAWTPESIVREYVLPAIHRPAGG